METLLWSLLARSAFSPLLSGGLRTAVAALLILPVYLWEGRLTRGPRWRAADLPVLLLLGLCGVALNQVLFIMGLSRTSVAHAAILIGLNPIVVLLMAALAGQERITWRKIGGMGIVLAGVGVLNAAPSRAPHASLAGHACARVSAAAWASLLYMAAISLLLYHSSLVSLRAAKFLGAGRYGRQPDPARACTAPTIPAICHLPCGAAAPRVAAFAYLQPLLATLLALPVLGEPLTAPLMLGGALAFCGVWLAEHA